MTQADDRLLLHCAACDTDRPRGWFARAGAGRRDSWCRECRVPGRALTRAKRRMRLALCAEPLPRDLYARLWRRQAGRCGICSSHMVYGVWELDHVIAIARGGRHEISNLQLAHAQCNRRKGAKT